jgi:hypothetical protein
MKADKNSRLYVPAAAGGPFTIPPISFTGFTFLTTTPQTGGVADALIRFRGSGAIPNTTQGLLEQVNSAFTPAPNQPNWHSNVGAAGNPDAGNYSCAITNIVPIQGSIVIRNPVGVTPPVLGEFFRMNTFQRDWQLTGPPNGTNATYEADVTFQIAQWDDTSNVFAEATIKYLFIRGSG